MGLLKTNRSANKMLATVTAREAFGQDTIPQQLADRLPLDMMVDIDIYWGWYAPNL
jgi:hypothetical protein